MKRRIKIILLCVFNVMLYCLAGCDEETTEDGGEKLGVYYEALDSDVVCQRYNGGLSLCAYLRYNNQIYTSVGTYDSLDKSQLPMKDMIGKELATVYGNNGIYWSTDKYELAEVTKEAKIYKLKGYDRKFRVCIYYEINVDIDNTTHHIMQVFECLNDVYLYKGRNLFLDRMDLSSAVKVMTNDCTIALEDEKLQTFLEALYDGTFITKSDEAYPDLSNVCSSKIIFYDEYGFENDIVVYENGYVTKSVDGQETVVIKVDESVCRQMVCSWDGIYRTDIAMDIVDNKRENHYIKVDIGRTVLNGDDMQHISVYMKKVIKPIDTEGVTKEEVVLNNEVKIPLDITDNLVFSMKESGFLDNAEELDIKDVYVELRRESGNVIYFRYADNDEALKQQEFIILKRSEY